MKITQKMLQERLNELTKQYNGKINYYMESGMYRLSVDGLQVGEVMSLREAYKSIILLNDVLILVERDVL